MSLRHYRLPLACSLALTALVGGDVARTCQASGSAASHSAVPETPGTIPGTVRLSPAAVTPALLADTIDPAARSLLKQMLTAQAVLTSYSANITIHEVKGEEVKNIRVFLAYQKSGGVNRLYLRVVNDAERTTQTFVQNDANCYGTDSSTPLIYKQDEAGPGIYTLSDMAIQSGVDFSSVYPLMLVAGSPPDDETLNQTTIVKGPDEVVDGTARDVIRTVGVKPMGYSLAEVTPKLFAIGKKDHLLRWHRYRDNSGDTDAERMAGQVITLTFFDVKVNPVLSPPLFVFTPQPGAIGQPMPKGVVK